MNIEQLSSLDEILPVLAACDLPIADISASAPQQFFGIRRAGRVVGVVGLEHFQSVGLLRSLAVMPAYRGCGFGKALVQHVESLAVSGGIESLFLLTTSAESFFTKLGYRLTSRQDAPPAIQTTTQFSGLCPSSSSFLSKRLGLPGADADSQQSNRFPKPTSGCR